MNQIIGQDRNLAITLMPSLQLNLDGFVHAQTMLATMPSASMYMQLNFIAVKARHLSLPNQVDDPILHLSKSE